jgi:diguanylate cyclase (GGDEF)-like protein
MRDDLTGLPNRRSILEFARAQLRVCRVDGSRMCLALIDIDHFKSINDRSGHAVGDAVLSAFAEICAQQLRSNDRLGRYGGEEFLLIMPGSDLNQVPLVFARLRDAVQLIDVSGLDPKSLTFSMGAVEVTGPAEDLDQLIKRADDALYRAKQGGRDRYELGKQPD